MIARLQRQNFNSHRTVGIDIGTGFSGVYSLLAAKVYHYEMVGTDVEPLAIENASALAAKNSLPNLRFVPTRECDSVFSQTVIGVDERFDFCMSNPPFYASIEEHSRFDKKTEPTGKIVGERGELFCSEGSFGFLERMLCSSVAAGSRILWFTCLVFKRSLLERIQAVADGLRIPLHFYRSFQIGKTRRWIFIWSFHPFPAISTYRYVLFSAHQPLEDAIGQLKLCFESCEVPAAKDTLRSSGAYFEYGREISGCTWARSAKRKKAERPGGCVVSLNLSLEVTHDGYPLLSLLSNSPLSPEASQMYGSLHQFLVRTFSKK